MIISVTASSKSYAQGQNVKDYFRLLNLDETRRKYLENIKEGKQVDREIEEQLFKNGNREQH